MGMITGIREMLSYGFLARALIVGALVSLCAALLGVSLVLKRVSMIGDGLSHVGFGALSVAAAMNLAPLQVAAPVVMLAAFLLLRLSESSAIKGDAAIGLVASTALAAGILASSFASGMTVDVYSYMFGSILSMTWADVALAAALSAVVIALYIAFYNRIFAVTFDESFARATGTRAGLFHTVLALLTAATVVVGMRLMGTLLISSLVIFPALTAMRVCRRFFSVVVCAAAVSVGCFLTGLAASYALSTPTGASVVAANALCFAVFALIGFVGRRAA